MKKRFTEEQIIGFLREADVDMSTPLTLQWVDTWVLDQDGSVEYAPTTAEKLVVIRSPPQMELRGAPAYGA